MNDVNEAGPRPSPLFAEPTPMGLIGLAVGCAALTPIAFGMSLTRPGLETAAMFCLFFGAGCQFLAGILNYANRNVFGATLFTTFAFNWLMNWWALDSLAKGVVPDHAVVLAVDVAFLVIFLVMTYGFGFFSSVLFLLMLDIDLLYACRVIDEALGIRVLDLPIALLTVGLGLVSLWIAFAILINPVAGRNIFPIGGALYKPKG